MGTLPATTDVSRMTLADTLDSMAAWFAKYTVLPGDFTPQVLALWAAHTWVSTSFYTTPRIVLSSPVPGSGKTRVLELLALVCFAPRVTVNSSTAAIYRRIAGALNSGHLPPTLLYDETDALFAARPGPQAEDMRALLNAGYKHGATVDRCEGDSHEVVEFPVFSPVALAGLAGHMPDTITTRAITVEMKKRRRGESITPYKERKAKAEMATVRAFLESWANGVRDELADAEPVMPDGVEDRPAEVWEPLLILADSAEGHWPATAREACRSFVFAPEKRPPSQGVELLADIRRIMGHDPDDLAAAPLDRIRTADLVSALKDLPESAWGGMNGGTGITDRRVAQILSGYDVRSTQIRDERGSGKGYTTYQTTRHGAPYQAGLHDAWSRYLPDPIRKKGNIGNSGNAAGQGAQNLLPNRSPFGNEGNTVSETGNRKGTENMPSTCDVTDVPLVSHSANGVGGAPGSEPSDQSILEALATEFGLSPETISGSVPGLSRDAAPERLQRLVDSGLAAVDHRNRYTRKATA